MKEVDQGLSELPPIELRLGEKTFPFKDCRWPESKGTFSDFLRRKFIFQGIKGEIVLVESDLESFDFPVEFPLARPVRRTLEVTYNGEIDSYNLFLLAEKFDLVIEIGDKRYRTRLDGDNLVEDETGDFDPFEEALDDLELGKAVHVYSKGLNSLDSPKEVKLPFDEIVKDKIVIGVESRWGL